MSYKSYLVFLEPIIPPKYSTQNTTPKLSPCSKSFVNFEIFKHLLDDLEMYISV
ncbi:hypothetical protein NBO_2g0052 [Nosema bombycis CQ1]|uniref:Uncharacterized protein n=1 Tax=Nosema bombycis (strain CQ1 / CVCC 102059) TaxID=578461 RepID=R0MMU6_NOSB1|nr:hypothetical protein NBO_2g0052 [Nosema bombycis CQ1]|eukprot:EOB15560.1 hypothetical protein NBO_2g0052 [Nosema bombycis CQ1]